MSDEVLSSSWCTAWQSYNTPRLWAMVAEEDDPEAWRQVAAWGDISSSVKDQRALLAKAREDLVAAWPPEQNKSAAAFVQELDTLIGRMDAARADADETATGLANILEALRQAKNNIQPLYEQYKEKSDDLVPAWFDNAEDELDEQARAHMITAEGIVQENVARLKVPEPYELTPEKPHFDPQPARDDGRPAGVRGGPGATGSAGVGVGAGGSISVPHDPVPPMPGREPTIPDGVTGGPDPSPRGDGTTGGGPTGGGTGSVTPPAGPGLAGVITPPGIPPVETLPPGNGPFPGGGGGGGGPLTGGAGGPFPPGVVPPSQGGGSGPVRGVTGASGGVGPGGAARGGVRPVTGRALPSGAVIGETVAGTPRGALGGVGGVSGRGGVAPGRSGVGGGVGAVGGGSGGVGGRAGAGSVGGVSGRPGTVTGRGGVAGRAGAARGAEQPRPIRPSWLPDDPAGSARAGAGPVGVSGGARGTRRAGDGSQPAFDPDNPWQVAEGVDPVIAPSTEEHTHDPGPNVIGWRG